MLTGLTRLLKYAGPVALCAILVTTAWLGSRNIAATLPYPQHVDEPAIASAAERMLVTGSLHPSTFNYPALPKYIAAAGLALGFVRQAPEPTAPTHVVEIGNVGFPYYTDTAAMQTARELFLLVAVAGLALTAWMAVLTNAPAAAGWSWVVAPIVVIAAPLYFYHAWTYLNVDVVGTFFVTASLCAVLVGARAPSVRSLAVIPALLAGCAIASKYTLAPVLAAVLTGCVAYAPIGQRIRYGLVAIACAAATYLLLAPYTLLDVPGFLNGIAFEAHHYATRHPGFDDQPGLPQLAFYGRHALSEFGIVGCLLVLIGVTDRLRLNARQTAVLLAVPVLTLALLSRQRVHFARNVLALYPIVATFAVAGIACIARLISGTELARRRGHLAYVVAVLVLVVACVPPTRLVFLVEDRTDSRNSALEWIQRAVAPSWTLVVPDELGMDTRTLEAEGRPVKHVALSAGRTPEAAAELLQGVGSPSVILVPVWGADPFFPGEKKADDLRRVAAQWTPIKQFGSSFVQTNHENGAPDGHPAFGIAPLDLPAEWVEFLRTFDERFAAKAPAGARPH